MKGIDSLADSFVEQKQSENPIAFYKEFGDRIDGKAHQSVDASITGGMTVTLDNQDAEA